MGIFLAALPWVGTTVASMLPVIIDSFSKGRSPEEAAAMLAPKRAMLLQRFVDSGMSPAQAAPIVDQLIQGEMANAQLPEHMSPFATATLSVIGAVGGYKGGAMLASKLGPKAAAGATAAAVAAPVAAAEVAAAPKPAAHPDIPIRDATYTPGFRSPQAERGFAGEFDSVTPVRRGGNLGYDAPPQYGKIGYDAPDQALLGYNQTPIPMGMKPVQEPISMGFKMNLTPSAEDAMLMEQLAEMIKRRQMSAAHALRRNQFNWQGESPAMAREMGQPVMGDVI